MTKTVIIVAGGKGERMNADLPKQFLEIQGKPILMHTLEAFRCYDAGIKLILVLPAVQIDFWKNLCERHDFTLSHQIIVGGQTRFHSVKNGLAAVTDSGLVAVHDGVRPLVSKGTIARCFDEAEKQQAAIPVIDLVDSLRKISGDGSQSVDRSAYKLVQTPQIFKTELLKKAYEQGFSPLFTDDASVVETLLTQPSTDETIDKISIHLVEGNRENIKITTEIDLDMAEILLKKRQNK